MNLRRRIERFAFLFIFKSPQTPLYKRGAFFMMWLLVILLGIYLRELRTENVYGLLSSPLFRKEGLFMMLLLVILLGIYLRELRTESIYLPIKYPLFRKEGARGDLTTATYLKLISPTPLYKRGAFL